MSIEPIFESKEFDLIVSIHGVMESEAIGGESLWDEPYGDPTLKVWEGFQSDLGKRIGISASYVSRLLSYMEKMGCVESVERGFRGTRSRYAIVKPPTQQDFINRNVVAEREAEKKARELGEALNHEERIKALERMISELAVELRRKGMLGEN